MEQEKFYWEQSWPEILAEQERLLRYDSFTRQMALELGLKIQQLATQSYDRTCAIRIVEDGMTIFSYKMPGTNRENDWWMDRKLATSLLTGTSSLRAYVEAEAGLRTAEWADRADNFAVCGGCFPVLRRDGKAAFCHVLVSGMEHQYDHQIMADAMAWQLGVRIPTIR